MLYKSIYLFTLLFTFITIYAAPVFSTTKMTEASHVLTDILSGFYESIVDDVMLDVSENILRYVPESISHDNKEARLPMIKSMGRQLKFMRASLLASVNPLVSLDTHRIVELQAADLESAERLTQKLSTALPHLNQKISHQLGLIVNANQSSAILIRQAASLIHQSKAGQTAVIKLDWKVRQPFQVSVVREDQPVEEMDSTFEWVLNKLSQIEVNLMNEFNDRVQEVTGLVLETFTI